MRSPSCLCACESHPMNFLMPETWYVYNGTWAHLSGVLHKSLPPVCVSGRVSMLPLPGKGSVKLSIFSLLGNGSVKTLPQKRIHMRSVSYQRKVSDHFFPQLLVYITLYCHSRCTLIVQAKFYTYAILCCMLVFKTSRSWFILILYNTGRELSW
jgi:hypothetical protein